jgi:polyhydroxybutyrate depolymerase
MNHARILGRSTVLASLTALALHGCGSTAPTSSTAGTGGMNGGSSGGAIGSGGGMSSGGAVGSGGTVGTGGVGTGGAATGGAETGGNTPNGTGGRLGATGGRGGGGAGAGAGGKATGGSSATGGAGSGGAAGSPSLPPSGSPVPSAGCDATPTTTSCNTQNAPCMLDVGGTQRKYWVQLPDGYDPKRPYPIVFQYHPLGGNGWQGLTMYNVRPKFPAAIYVSPDGLTSGQYQGFSNTKGEDEALTRAMMAELEAKYCTDKSRYFATGFSFGGSMSYTAACNMSDAFRAIGAMSGAPISGATCTSKKPARPVAVWATHGDADTALPITLAQPIIDALVKYNGCSSETKPVDPSPCVEYQGCTTGYPVVWCVRPGDPHAIPSFAAGAIAKFFQQF